MGDFRNASTIVAAPKNTWSFSPKTIEGQITHRLTVGDLPPQ